MKLIQTAIALLMIATGAKAQNAPETNDSLRREMRSYVARNFSDIRTFNFSWQTLPTQGQHFIHFSTTLPLILKPHFSLYGVGQSDFYNYDKNDHSQYYRVGLNATYRTTLAGKPFIVNGSAGVDGYKHGVQQPLLMVAGLSVLKRERQSTLSAGLSLMWPFTTTPVVPVVAYWRRFSPNWMIDVTLPRQVYMRYLWGASQRLSLGCEMLSNQYYFRSDGVTRLYSETQLNAGLKYEYVAMHHFYFFVHGGLSTTLSNGIYRTNRSEVVGNKLVYNHNPRLFFETGFSYNIFK